VKWTARERARVNNVLTGSSGTLKGNGALCRRGELSATRDCGGTSDQVSLRDTPPAAFSNLLGLVTARNYHIGWCRQMPAGSG